MTRRVGYLLFAALVMTVGCTGGTGHSFGPPSVAANNDAVESFQKEDFPGAFQGFGEALSRDSLNPLYHFNLGNAFAKNAETTKALEELSSVAQLPRATDELKFKSYFNAAAIAAEAKEIAKALELYQKALEIVPDSKEVKTNIELLLKQNQGGGGGGDDKKDDPQKGDDKKESKDQKDGKDRDNDEKKDQGQQQNQQQKPKPTPRPFNSKEMTEGDVRRILDELKRQEQEVRAKEDKSRRQRPERPVDKDW